MRICLFIISDHSTVQRPLPYLHVLESIAEEYQQKSSSTSKCSPTNSSEHSPSDVLNLSLPSTAITTSKEDNYSPVKTNEDKLPVPTQCPIPNDSSGEDHFNTSLSMNYLDTGSNKPLAPEQAVGEEMSFGENVLPNANVKREQSLEAETAPELTTIKGSQKLQAKKTLITKDIVQGYYPGPRTPVRRTKSDGKVRAVCHADEQSAVPRVSIDATINDRLWSKLDPSTHRDSVSSSSSISSNDTVIDLSLPNLARKSLTSLRAAQDCNDSQDSVANWSCPSRSSTTPSMLCVSKSKSNPNLRDGQMCDPVDELLPRQLGSEHDNKRFMQRRHTWSRLYIEGLKQSSSASSKRAPTPVQKDKNGGSKSKSLGDLTSEDIVCNFDSKYRSISRSFVVRPSRQQRSPKKPQDDLMERLKKLTDVEPLTSSDFTSQNHDSETEEKEEQEEALPLRRSSSRSQSRVRYIANRARQAQERQRLQSLLRGSNTPIEERGIPEGACSITRSPCVNLDLLSQLPPGPPQQSPRSPDSEVLFMLRLWWNKHALKVCGQTTHTMFFLVQLLNETLQTPDMKSVSCTTVGVGRWVVRYILGKAAIRMVVHKVQWWLCMKWSKGSTPIERNTIPIDRNTAVFVICLL